MLVLTLASSHGEWDDPGWLLWSEIFDTEKLKQNTLVYQGTEKSPLSVTLGSLWSSGLESHLFPENYIQQEL